MYKKLLLIGGVVVMGCQKGPSICDCMEVKKQGEKADKELKASCDRLEAARIMEFQSLDSLKQIEYTSKMRKSAQQCLNK